MDSEKGYTPGSESVLISFSEVYENIPTLSSERLQEIKEFFNFQKNPSEETKPSHFSEEYISFNPIIRLECVLNNIELIYSRILPLLPLKIKLSILVEDKNAPYAELTSISKDLKYHKFEVYDSENNNIGSTTFITSVFRLWKKVFKQEQIDTINGKKRKKEEIHSDDRLSRGWATMHGKIGNGWYLMDSIVPKTLRQLSSFKAVTNQQIFVSDNSESISQIEKTSIPLLNDFQQLQKEQKKKRYQKSKEKKKKKTFKESSVSVHQVLGEKIIARKYIFNFEGIVKDVFFDDEDECESKKNKETVENYEKIKEETI